MKWTPTTWQLPKPMMEVIAAHENGYVGTAIWVPKHHLTHDECDECDCDFNEADGEYYAPEGWYNVDIGDICYKVDSPVTHWMAKPLHPNKN